MATTLIEVGSKPELKEWVRFPFRLYRGYDHYVPQIIRDEIDFFSADRNPSFKVANTKLILARQNNKTVGRVCGIIHRLEAEKLGYKRGRFGWFECIDDSDTGGALLGYLEKWFIREGCREITGPHGFTDLDPEGLLIDGFDALPTISGSYNPTYYRRLLEDFGLEKEVDYIEHRIKFPEEATLFRRLEKKAAAVEKEGYRALKFDKKKSIYKYMDQFWEVLEISFEHLFGITPLSDEQKKYYTKKYFGFIDPSLLQIVVDRHNQVKGLFLGLPSLSRAFQKANGRLLPFGFLHILRGFKKFDTVDFYLAGIHPEANFRKIFPLLVLGMYKVLREKAVRYVETNRELENNTTLTRIWTKFSVVNKRRTRIFSKQLY